MVVLEIHEIYTYFFRQVQENLWLNISQVYYVFCKIGHNWYSKLKDKISVKQFWEFLKNFKTKTT